MIKTRMLFNQRRIIHECVYLFTRVYPILLLWPWPWSDDLDTWTWPKYSEDVSAYQKCSF